MGWKAQVVNVLYFFQYIKSAFIPSLMGTAVKTGDKETLMALHHELGTFNIPMLDDRTLLHIAAVSFRRGVPPWGEHWDQVL